MEQSKHEENPTDPEKPKQSGLKSVLEKLLSEKQQSELVKLVKVVDEHKKLNGQVDRQLSQEATAIVAKLLKKEETSLDASMETLMLLSRAFNEASVRYFVGRAIYHGFQEHWKKEEFVLTEKDRGWALGLRDMMSTSFLQEYLSYFFYEAYLERHAKALENQVWELLRNHEQHRTLKLIKGLKLLPFIDAKKLVKALMNAEIAPKEMEFIFSGNQLLQEHYAKQLYRTDFKACVDFVHRHGLNPNNYPGMVWGLEKGWMSYCIKTFTLDQLELKFMHDSRYLSYLAVRMFAKNRPFAQSLLMKYNLYQNDVFVREGYQQRVYQAYQNRSTETILPNQLVVKDCFGATQSRILGETQNYLELQDLKLSEADVVLVNCLDANFEHARLALSNATVIGLDCEFTSGYTKFHKASTLNLIQLSTYDKVFLLDAQTLTGLDEFKRLLRYLFFEHPTNTIVGFSAGEDLNLVRECIGLEGAKSLECPRFVDVQKVIGGKGSHNLSLKKCVEKHFEGKKFSKFEQCSGWNARPFRRAQLHYAALDARVLLELYDKVKDQAVPTVLGITEQRPQTEEEHHQEEKQHIEEPLNKSESVEEKKQIEDKPHTKIVKVTEIPAQKEQFTKQPAVVSENEKQNIVKEPTERVLYVPKIKPAEPTETYVYVPKEKYVEMQKQHPPKKQHEDQRPIDTKQPKHNNRNTHTRYREDTKRRDDRNPYEKEPRRQEANRPKQQHNRPKYRLKEQPANNLQ